MYTFAWMIPLLGSSVWALYIVCHNVWNLYVPARESLGELSSYVSWKWRSGLLFNTNKFRQTKSPEGIDDTFGTILHSYLLKKMFVYPFLQSIVWESSRSLIQASVLCLRQKNSIFYFEKPLGN